MDMHDDHDELDFDDDEDLPPPPTPPPVHEEPSKPSDDENRNNEGKKNHRGGEEGRGGSKRSRSGKRPTPINPLFCSYEDYLAALRRAGLIGGSRRRM